MMASSFINSNIKDVFRKIKVTQQGVIVEREFEHKYKARSKLYVSEGNDLLLEFTKDLINIHTVRATKQTVFLSEFKRPLGLDVPQYFTPDFYKCLQFNFIKMKRTCRHGEVKEVDAVVVQVFETKLTSHTYETYKIRDNSLLPDYKEILKNNAGLPYIRF